MEKGNITEEDKAKQEKHEELKAFTVFIKRIFAPSAFNRPPKYYMEMAQKILNHFEPQKRELDMLFDKYGKLKEENKFLKARLTVAVKNAETYIKLLEEKETLLKISIKKPGRKPKK